MSIEGMRVGGRCPPLLVGILIVACFVLVCNWWTISSENLELLRQIDELHEHLKISVEERDQCLTVRSTLENKYKISEDEVASLHLRLEQMNSLKKRAEELTDSLTMCKSELDSLNKLDATKTATLETLRLEKETINAQLDTKKDENQNLREEVDRVKSDLDKLKLSCNPPPEKTVHTAADSQTNTKVENETVNGGNHEEQERENLREASKFAEAEGSKAAAETDDTNLDNNLGDNKDPRFEGNQ